MTFEKALEQLKQGNKVSRRYWYGIHKYLFLADPLAIFRSDTGSRSFTPPCNSIFVLMSLSGEINSAWTPTASDMLATDWELVL